MRSSVTILLVCCLSVATPTWAGSKPNPSPPRRAPAPAAVVPPKPAAPEPTANPQPAAKETKKASAPRTGDPKSLLVEIGRLDAAMEYDQIPALAESVLKAPESTADQQLEARRYLGSALAIVADPVDAEPPFRILLRERPDFDLPDTTPPKILAVFRKVQGEERALADQMRTMRRKRLAGEIQITGELPHEGQGGKAAPFSFKVRDLNGVVETVRVPYRKADQPTFSSLALEHTDDGQWRGQLPGEYMASATGFVLEYFVEADDAAGRLTGIGAESSPLKLAVCPGQVATPRFRLPRWLTITAGALTLGLVAAAGGAGLQTQATQRRYDALTASLSANGADLVAVGRQGQAWSSATTGLLIAASGGALLTLGFAPFTEW